MQVSQHLEPFISISFCLRPLTFLMNKKERYTWSGGHAKLLFPCASEKKKKGVEERERGVPAEFLGCDESQERARLYQALLSNCPGCKDHTWETTLGTAPSHQFPRSTFRRLLAIYRLAKTKSQEASKTDLVLARTYCSVVQAFRSLLFSFSVFHRRPTAPPPSPKSPWVADCPASQPVLANHHTY